MARRTARPLKVLVGRVDNGSETVFVAKGTTIREAFAQGNVTLSTKDSVMNHKTGKTVDKDSECKANQEYVATPMVDSAYL